MASALKKIPRASLLLFVLLLWGIQLVSSSPVPVAADHHVLQSQSQQIVSQKSGEKIGALEGEDEDKKDEDKKDEDKGWSWKTWLIVIACAIVGFIVLSCFISYLFCACAKEIICLPITCLTKCLCCCCKD